MTNTTSNFANISALTSDEAARKLKTDGYNELPSKEKQSILRLIFDIVREPMIVLLLFGGILYCFLGSIYEALSLLSFVIVIIAITFFQERKSEHALSALRDISSPRALVFRDNMEKRIASREIVTDDILILHEGNLVPADAELFFVENLLIDESLLTGESLPVAKNTKDKVFSGTLIVRGYGIAKTYATGINTEIGKIGKALKTLSVEKTPLQKDTNNLVKNFAIIGLFLSLIVVVVYGFTRSNWLQGILAGITLAMAVLPEEFPVVLTTFLALGAWRISQSHVLTRRVPAIEALGSATVLCVDKTGTLTLNKMTVKRFYANVGFYDVNLADTKILPEDFHELAELSILASQRDPFDPMEKAILELGNTYLKNTEHLHDDWQLIRQYPLSKELLSISHVWQSPNGLDYTIATKGAPESIFDLCHLDDVQTKLLTEKVKLIAKDGMRVLGVAKASFHHGNLPAIQHDFHFEFLGLIGLSDPIRPTVKDAIQKCYDAGMRTIMMTGDYSETARYIAREIGLNSPNEVISGSELAKMNDIELKERIKKNNIFARIMPEQKLRLVNALKENNEIVAMTGDGVNDAPALKAANIGIAMGERGTDVAREAAALVLLDDDFSSIVNAVKQGRTIFDNIKKAVAYILAVHVPIAGISLLPVLLKLPLMLFPIHIVFLELIIDPVSSIAFEAEPPEKDIMTRPPRKSSESLFSKEVVGISLLQGFSVLFIVFLVFIFAKYLGQSEAEIRALTFITLIFANIGLIFVNRSWCNGIIKTCRVPNKTLLIVLIGAMLVLVLILFVPFMQRLFHFGKLHLIDVTVCIVAGFISMIWNLYIRRIIFSYSKCRNKVGE